MDRKIRVCVSNVVCMLLIVSLSGCSMGWEQRRTPAIDDSELFPALTRIIDEQWSLVAPFLEEELALSGRGTSDIPDAPRLVELILEEETGRDYMQFCYAVANGDDSSIVVEYARGLLPQQEYDELRLKVEETERSMRGFMIEQSRALPPNQRAAFMRDLQKLVTKTVVLLVAGIVYACIPNVVFWGKVTAASAVAVASGIVATTVLSIYRFYQYNSDELSVSFQEWIVDVTTDPAAAYAMASSMMAVGKTMVNGPVVTGLVIAVFSIYQVMDMLKPMLKKYNFSA
jgi:hypothetical protein